MTRHTLVFTALALLSCASCASSAGTPPVAPAPAKDRMGVHGMVVFGTRTIFMSHIPMFKAPHDYQLVLEVDLGAAPDRPASFSSGLYTFEPKPFSLDLLRKGELREMSGTLFRGNFEDGGQPVMKDVRVVVKRVVGTPQALLDRPAGPKDLEYSLIGSKDEAFVIHSITRAAAFDQIAVAHVSGVVEDVQLADGVTIIVPGHKNLVSERLGGGTSTAGHAAGGNVTLAIDRELSCLVGPDFASPCP